MACRDGGEQDECFGAACSNAARRWHCHCRRNCKGRLTWVARDLAAFRLNLTAASATIEVPPEVRMGMRSGGGAGVGEGGHEEVGAVADAMPLGANPSTSSKSVSMPWAGAAATMVAAAGRASPPPAGPDWRAASMAERERGCAQCKSKWKVGGLALLHLHIWLVCAFGSRLAAAPPCRAGCGAVAVRRHSAPGRLAGQQPQQRRENAEATTWWSGPLSTAVRGSQNGKARCWSDCRSQNEDANERRRGLVVVACRGVGCG